MEKLFDQFIKEKRFLANAMERTIVFYRQSFNAFKKHNGSLDKAGLAEFVINMRQAGLSPVTCNIYIRGINSFLSWAFEQDHLPKLRIKQLKEEKKALKVFTDEHLKAIINWKPKGFLQWRIYALLCLLMETGMRINECISLSCKSLDFDNALITVKGKGNKDRILPMSVELRRVLYRYMQVHAKTKLPDRTLLFPTRTGRTLLYRSISRQFQELTVKLTRISHGLSATGIERSKLGGICLRE